MAGGWILSSFGSVAFCQLANASRNRLRSDQETFGVVVDEKVPWLRVDSPLVFRQTPIVIHRSERYQNVHFPWRELVKQFCSSMLFVGLQEEYDAFTKEFGSVHWYCVADLMEMARIIAGCRVFIGNQSCPFAIAEGLKVNAIQGTWDYDPNCVFDRPNVRFFEPNPRCVSDKILKASCTRSDFLGMKVLIEVWI